MNGERNKTQKSGFVSHESNIRHFERNGENSGHFTNCPSFFAQPA